MATKKKKKKKKHAGHGRSNKHSGSIQLTNGKATKVKDKNGNTAPGQTAGPTGQVVSVDCLALVTVQTQGPSAECWIYYDGVWYQWC
jgi:hypothetical protein